jgi:hypothetical protein
MTMFVPPLVIDVRVRETHSRGHRIWLPLFLLWPLLLVVVGLALLISALVDLALLVAGARYHHYTLLLLGCIRLLSETRGTHVHADSKNQLVEIDIY